jgi:hypothetical protein
MIIRYKWDGNFTAASLDANIPPGFTATIQQIGPDVFVDLNVDPAPTAPVQEDLDGYMATLGWSFVEADPTTPTSCVNKAISVYDAVGGQVFTGTVTILFDTVSKNMAVALYNFDAVAGTIEVLATGSYEIGFDISLDAGANVRTSSKAWLQKNSGGGFVDVGGTDGFGYHRNVSNGLDTASMSTLVDLVAGDVLRVRAQRLGTTGTLLSVTEGSRFNVNCLA